MGRKITFAIAGYGDRGSVYASMERLFSDRMQIVAVADINPIRVEKARKRFGIVDELCFSSAEEMLKRKRLADVMVVATMDRQHIDHAAPAIEKGYHVLMEKPISPSLNDCVKLAQRAKAKETYVLVCHVLRYTPFFNRLKLLLGSVGKPVAVIASENVGYWHHAHSFVRGNWRNADETSPMILQKCCHDMDMLLWLLGEPCISVSSIGSNYLFRADHAPAGATDFCLGGCKVKSSCPFDAEKIYIEDSQIGIRHGSLWPASVLSAEQTIESVYAALKQGPYGRCVYACDNNVVDHQQSNLLFASGLTASFTMCGFTESCYREMKFMCTAGEIHANMDKNQITVQSFGNERIVYDLNTEQVEQTDFKGHGGGDAGIISDLLDLLEGGSLTERTTTIEVSLESHFLAMAAEKSRLSGGRAVSISDLKSENGWRDLEIIN